MAFRLYIVPVIGVGTNQDPRRAKYFTDGTIASTDYAAMDYGFEPWMVVGADLSVSDDATIIGKADAFALPFDLGSNLTAAQVTNVQSKLEAINVPADWVDTSLTWAQVARTVFGMFQYVQRLTAILTISAGSLQKLFQGGVTLATQVNQLPPGAVNALQQAANDLHLSTAGISGATTLRVALKLLADQFASWRFNFGLLGVI